MADFGGELDAFRLEVRDWLKANYPAELANPVAGREARPNCRRSCFEVKISG